MQYRHDSSETGKLNVAWVQGWNTFLKELRVLIKNHHTTGLTWNASGGDAASFVGAAAAAPSSGGPPPPGPPPPPVILAPAGGKQVDHGALFAEIEAVKERQKSGKTEGLRHVTKEMKTKSRDGSEAAPVPVSGGAKKASAPAAAKKTTPAKPPKFELEGNKWLVENQVGNHSLVIAEPEPKHAVYVYRCDDSVLQIKGKVNTITIDSCHKTAVVFDTAISSVEIVN